jgi:hypothetical protein
MLTEAEALAFYETTGQWSADEESQLTGLQDDIQKLKRGLLDHLFQPERLSQVRATLRRAEKVLVEKWHKRDALLMETAEKFADMAQQRYTIGRVTETEDGESVWPTTASFEMCSDNTLINHLVHHYYVGSRPPERVIREVARTDPWRTLWLQSKHVHQLFDNPPVAWSAAQSDLVRWTQIYDFVYESLDRPGEQIINDDDLLDSWLIRQSDKAGEQAKQRENDALAKAGGRNSRQGGRNETFIVTDQRGAKRVYEMNDAKSRRIVQQTQKYVQQHGTVKESDLPQSKAEMRQLAAEEFRKRVGST